jgi:hypothetical protein
MRRLVRQAAQISLDHIDEFFVVEITRAGDYKIAWRVYIGKILDDAIVVEGR